MKAQELIRLRLSNQCLSSSKFETCAGVVSHFGAMQSQDYAMAKWAVGMRTRNATDADVEKSIESGEIVRTHVLRPTWHFVSAKDVRWMMTLSAPQLKKVTQYVNRQVGLTDSLFKKAWKVVEAGLNRTSHLTKEEIVKQLAKFNIDAHGLLATQILIRAEMDMRICNGPTKNNKVTYSLFDRVIPNLEDIPREEALVKLASTYFRSRGPATLKDYAWWSGLSSQDAKTGMAALGAELKSVSVEGLNYFYIEHNQQQVTKVSALLPSFDEYMVGYTEGRDIVFSKSIDKSSLGNGVFKPIVMIDNAIAGSWKKVKSDPFVEIALYEKKKQPRKLKTMLKRFTDFQGYR